MLIKVRNSSKRTHIFNWVRGGINLRFRRSLDSHNAGHITSNFLKAAFHKFHLVHSWILCPIWSLSVRHLATVFQLGKIYQGNFCWWRSWQGKFFKRMHRECLTHQMPVLPSSMLPTANQLTGLYIRATLACNGLI